MLVAASDCVPHAVRYPTRHFFSLVFRRPCRLFDGSWKHNEWHLCSWRGQTPDRPPFSSWLKRVPVSHQVANLRVTTNQPNVTGSLMQERSVHLTCSAAAGGRWLERRDLDRLGPSQRSLSVTAVRTSVRERRKTRFSLQRRSYKCFREDLVRSRSGESGLRRIHKQGDAVGRRAYQLYA